VTRVWRWFPEPQAASRAPQRSARRTPKPKLRLSPGALPALGRSQRREPLAAKCDADVTVL
jgi:hypothetical protein